MRSQQLTVGRATRLIAAACSIALGTQLSVAAPLTSGNVLRANLRTGVLTEHNTNGTLVQEFTFPDPDGDSFDDLRDVIVDSDGLVHAWHGTFNPYVSTLDPATSTYTTQTFAGWSTVNNVSYGGITHFGDDVFVTDMVTAGAGSPRGIVRFAIDGSSTERFADSRDYQDVTLGGDGLLYGLRSSGNNVDVFDPNDLSSVRTIALDFTLAAADVRGIVADRSGALFAAAWDGDIYAADSDGNTLNSIDSGANDLTDIDLDNNGNLLVGGRFGQVILTDVNLSGVTSFAPDSDTVHVAFTAPLVPIPEPTSVSLAVGLGVALVIASARIRA